MDEIFYPCEEDDEDTNLCDRCHGDGFGFASELGVVDGINGPFDNDIVECPDCSGSGLL